MGLKNFQKDRDAVNRLYDAPENRRLKHAALAVITVVVILLLSMVIWLEDISSKTMLIMRGCAGLGAIVFVALVGVLSYRVNKRHLDNHGK